MHAAAIPALLLPGTLCGETLWSGVPLPSGTQARTAIQGHSLAEAASMALEGVQGQVHLVGFSLGAIVAFEVLRLAPERVARLTLISANPHAPTAAQLQIWSEQQARVQAGEFGALIGELSTGPHRQQLLDMAWRTGPQVFLEQLDLLRSRPDSRPTLARWTGPLTLLVGQDDVVTPPHLSSEMKALAPQADLRIVPRAGHYLPLDAPDALSEVLCPNPVRGVTYA
ncbi:alpha/beta hydrolase (plasmid) [Deinococcus sp. KNUC1210]|uniref:alpha/beta fold hydrolase n=1 Tax=Deinococcus sp. KNUC1210 TaxID=2917691 RepID=UPI001EEFA427|nr:alpha/beta hydrolase [Deinococcus sp. KNUC1210]ULH17731.1 alpha/beta hydrolase [Deinococcus sp. KNUC1210]